MTSVMPYTTASLMFEPRSRELLGTVTSPGTILDFVAKVSPSYLELIRLARMEAFFNDPNRSYTLFLSDIKTPVAALSPDFARQILTMSTLKGYVTTNMLTDGLCLDPVNPRERLYVANWVSEPSSDAAACSNPCSLVCSQPPPSQPCNNARVTCVQTTGIGPQAQASPLTCESLGKRLIQINNRALTRGDIFVNSGIVHLLDGPLLPWK